MAYDHYNDDPTIPHDAELWRRIPPWHFFHDENLGQIRPSFSERVYCEAADRRAKATMISASPGASTVQP